MDQAIVNGLDERIRGEYSVGLYYWSINLAYRLDAFSAENHPKNWAEFWDADTYPGPRGMVGMDFDPPPLEIPLLAAGIAPDALYPLDIDAAFASLDVVRPHITKWTGFAADAGQLLAQGELDLAATSSGNVFAYQDSGAELDLDWNQGILVFDALVMPKGAPNQENAWRYIEFCSRPEVQAAFFEAYPLAPVVQAAVPLIPEELLPRAVSDPEKLALQVPADRPGGPASSSRASSTSPRSTSAGRSGFCSRARASTELVEVQSSCTRAKWDLQRRVEARATRVRSRHRLGARRSGCARGVPIEPAESPVAGASRRSADAAMRIREHERASGMSSAEESAIRAVQEPARVTAGAGGQAWLRRHAWPLLTLPAVIFMLVTFAYPLVRLLLRSVFDPGFTTEHFRTMVEADAYAKVLLDHAAHLDSSSPS